MPSFKVVDVATGADVATVPAGFLAAAFIDQGRFEGATQLANGTLPRPRHSISPAAERADGTGDVLPGLADFLWWDPGKQTVLVCPSGTTTAHGFEHWNLSVAGPLGEP